MARSFSMGQLQSELTRNMFPKTKQQTSTRQTQSSDLDKTIEDLHFVSELLSSLDSRSRRSPSFLDGQDIRQTSIHRKTCGPKPKFFWGRRRRLLIPLPIFRNTCWSLLMPTHIQKSLWVAWRSEWSFLWKQRVSTLGSKNHFLLRPALK